MRGIFISYRREDGAGHAGRLYDSLRARFDSVFLDVSGIEAGVDYVEAINNAVGCCDLLIVVIGPRWSSLADAGGRRRLDNPHDFVRLEAAAALERNIRVIPVLVAGAEMPTADELPEPLKALARRQAFELRDARWAADVDELIAQIARAVAATRPAGPPAAATPGGARVDDGPKPGAARDQPGSRAAAPDMAPHGGAKRGRWLPAAGALALAAAVAVWLSLQPQSVAVPDLAGATLEDARARIEAAALVAGEVRRERDGGREPGTVIEQSPSPGAQVRPGSRIDLTLAAPAIRVPGVVGLDLEEARRSLASAGVTAIETQIRATDEAAPGRVVDQEPAPGVLAPGAEPAVRISVAAAPPSVEVPDLARLPIDEARRRLSAAGLAPGKVASVTTSAQPAGTIMQQTPAPGKRVSRNSAVDLTVAQATAPPKKASPRVAVRDLRGLTIDEARAALGRQDLGLGAVREHVTRDARAGTVIEQQPAAGQSVAPGGVVDVRIARAPAAPPTPAEVKVGSVTGLPLAQARTSLEKQGFAVGTVTYRVTETAKDGTVIQQEPARGNVAAAGSTVDLLVAKAAVKPPGAGGLPAVGSSWRYRYSSRWPGTRDRDFVYTVVAVAERQVRESLAAAGGDVADTKTFGAGAELVGRSVDGVALMEFSPFLDLLGDVAPKWRRTGISAAGVLPFASNWSIGAQATGRESVTVPAGRFDALRIDVRGTLLGAPPTSAQQLTRFELRIWYAPEVKRVVKYERRSYDQANTPLDQDGYELLRYELG